MSAEDLNRYVIATHAMQSGVALLMQQGSDETSPKHLRVGVNAAMCEHAALVELLVEKGVLTKDEYLKAIADEMETEQARYEEKLSTRGIPVNLA